MKLSIEIDDEKLARDAYQNFPEASAGSAIECVSWNYGPFRFVFHDHETGKEHRVNLEQAMKGVRLLAKAVGRGELPGLGLSLNDFVDYENSNNWDASGYDALAQMAIFGEVIYG